MDMGSSITAQIAAIGSGLSARRTAMAHLLFNVVTAGLAFVLLPPYLQLLAAPSLPASQLEPAFALTLFQSGFNLLGLALLLPLTGPFAALIRQLVRASQEREVDDLDAIPPPQPDQALEPAAEALRQTFGDLVVHLGWSLGAEPGLVPPRPTGLDGLQGELDRIELYLDQIHVEKLEAPEGRRLLHLLHGLDHLQRLHERLEEEPDRARTLRSDPALADLRQELLCMVSELPQSLAKDHWLAASQASAAAAEAIGASVQPLRHRVMEAIATGEPELERGTRPSALGIQQMLAAGIQLLPQAADLRVGIILLELATSLERHDQADPIGKLLQILVKSQLLGRPVRAAIAAETLQGCVDSRSGPDFRRCGSITTLGVQRVAHRDWMFG